VFCKKSLQVIENKRSACAKERQERRRAGKVLEGRELRDLGQRISGRRGEKEGATGDTRGATQIIVKTLELREKHFVRP
jgi:hypothetical protein